MTAEEYIAHAEGGDCLKHARTIAALLVAEGKQPWIGMLRDIRQMGVERFHAPLIPRGVTGRNVPAWTTHYVCCCDGAAYDPLLGRREPLESYSTALFGREIPVTVVP